MNTLAKGARHDGMTKPNFETNSCFFYILVKECLLILEEPNGYFK